MGNFKKMLFGEKMPDKDDPQYKKRYEKEVNAGMKFARWSHIDKVAERIQSFANDHTKAFLGIVFGLVCFCFLMNIYRLVTVHQCSDNATMAIQRQEQMLKERRNKVRVAKQNDNSQQIKPQKNE